MARGKKRTRGEQGLSKARSKGPPGTVLHTPNLQSNMLLGRKANADAASH